MCTVYIVFSKTLNRFYIGQTKHLELRISEHNSGKGNYTSMASDWVLVFSCECRDRKEAVAFEKKIKNRGAKRFLLDSGLVE